MVQDIQVVEPRLTSLSHGGSCGCKIEPGVLSEEKPLVVS
jgi:selenide,water dikinase